MPGTHIKKTVFVDRGALRRARRVLKATTDKETINRALELVAEEEEIIAAHEAVGGVGAVEKVYR